MTDLYDGDDELEAFELDEIVGSDGEVDLGYCSGCSGSGEGRYDGTMCDQCNGSGES